MGEKIEGKNRGAASLYNVALPPFLLLFLLSPYLSGSSRLPSKNKRKTGGRWREGRGENWSMERFILRKREADFTRPAEIRTYQGECV